LWFPSVSVYTCEAVGKILKQVIDSLKFNIHADAIIAPLTKNFTFNA